MWGYGRFRGGLSGLWFFFLLTLAAVTRAQSPDYSPGYEQYKHGHFDSAVVSFSQLISEQPVKKEGYYNRGLSYFHLNKFTEAKGDFNSCLQTDSAFEDARFMKVLTLQAEGDWKGAFDEFKRMNTSYAGYNELKKRIQYHNLSVYISRNWYYMLAIMFLFILLIGVVVKSYYTIKG